MCPLYNVHLHRKCVDILTDLLMFKFIPPHIRFFTVNCKQRTRKKKHAKNLFALWTLLLFFSSHT